VVSNAGLVYGWSQVETTEMLVLFDHHDHFEHVCHTKELSRL